MAGDLTRLPSDDKRLSLARVKTGITDRLATGLSHTLIQNQRPLRWALPGKGKKQWATGGGSAPYQTFGAAGRVVYMGQSQDRYDGFPERRSYSNPYCWAAMKKTPASGGRRCISTACSLDGGVIRNQKTSYALLRLPKAQNGRGPPPLFTALWMGVTRSPTNGAGDDYLPAVAAEDARTNWAADRKGVEVAAITHGPATQRKWDREFEKKTFGGRHSRRAKGLKGGEFGDPCKGGV